MLARALRDETWVLWLDVDVISAPSDLIRTLLATGKDIVHPHCVLTPGGPSFDRNAWRDHGQVLLENLRGQGPVVRLDTVGGSVLLVRADLPGGRTIHFGASRVETMPGVIADQAGGAAQSQSWVRARVAETSAPQRADRPAVSLWPRPSPVPQSRAMGEIRSARRNRNRGIWVDGP